MGTGPDLRKREREGERVISGDVAEGHLTLTVRSRHLIGFDEIDSVYSAVQHKAVHYIALECTMVTCNTVQ